jgi:hypothetical protein
MNLPAFKNTSALPSVLGPVSMTTDEKILGALDSLTFYLVPGPLPELNDAGTIVLNKNFNGVIKRLALQSINEKTVVIDRDLFHQMSSSNVDTAAFFAHEALIRAYYDYANKPLPSTEIIGNFVNAAFDPQIAPRLTPKSVARYMNDIGIATAVGIYRGYRMLHWSWENTTFLSFIVFDKKERVMREFSGDGSRYERKSGMAPGFEIWSVNLTERSEGQNWAASMKVGIQYHPSWWAVNRIPVATVRELTSTRGNFTSVATDWNNDPLLFLQK